MRRQIVPRVAHCGHAGFGDRFFQGCYLADQQVDLALLPYDDLVELIKQVFRIGGLDFKICQPLVGGVVCIFHELIGHEVGAVTTLELLIRPQLMTVATTSALAGLVDIKRPFCTACLRPQVTCICRWITLVPNQVEVLILQHPLEMHHAKGSARLLHLSLPGSTLLVGEAFDRALLAPTSRQDFLLYPDIPPVEKPALQAGLLHEPAQSRLIVLDATWRKSRKMLYLNPQLQRLPRISLKDVGFSNYRIRKAQGTDQLSTLEATCAALAQLERDGSKYQPLLRAFDGFVAQQTARMARGALSRQGR